MSERQPTKDFDFDFDYVDYLNIMFYTTIAQYKKDSCNNLVCQ